MQSLLREVEEGLTRQDLAVMNARGRPPGRGRHARRGRGGGQHGNVRRTMLRLAERHLLLANWAPGAQSTANMMLYVFYLNGQMDDAEMCEMHRRAGAHYQTDEPDPLRAAWHYERAGDHDLAHNRQSRACRIQ